MHRTRREFVKVAMALPLAAALDHSALARSGAAPLPDEWIAYIGTYTRTTSKGIYAWRFRPSTGALAPLGLVAAAKDPTWFSLHPNGKYVYCTNELVDYDGQKSGSITVYSPNPHTGALTELNRVSSQGMNPSYSVVDATGKWLIVANYGGPVEGAGSVAVFRIHDDGRLDEKPSQFVPHTGSGPDPSNQEAAHPHATIFSPDDRFLFVPDKGADRIVQYKWDAKAGRLSPNDPPFIAAPSPGSGPRHMTFGVNKRFAYVNHELSSMVTAYAYDSKRGSLTALQNVSSLPEGFRGMNTTAEIEAHPSGKFLYVSNRGHDSVALFFIDPRKGTLTLLGHTPSGGNRPRKTQLDPTGNYMFVENQNSDTVVIFRIDAGSGKLTPTGTVLQVAIPLGALFIPATA